MERGCLQRGGCAAGYGQVLGRDARLYVSRAPPRERHCPGNARSPVVGVEKEGGYGLGGEERPQADGKEG